MMWSKAILFKFLLFYFVQKSYEFVAVRFVLNSGCQIFQLCDFLPKDGEYPVSGQQIERIKERVATTKQRIQNIEFKRVQQAERLQSKWRKRANKLCEAPELKINKILECDNLHRTLQNLNYFTELEKFCIKLLQAAEKDVDNDEMIRTVKECEEEAHSLVAFKKLQSLLSNLQKRCVWEKKRQIAVRHARHYEERAKKLRAEANKFEKLIENGIKIEGNEKLKLDLTKEQIEQLAKVLGQKTQEQAYEIEEKVESSEEEEKSHADNHDENVNDFLEIISRKLKSNERQKPQAQSSEEMTMNPSKSPANTSSDKLSVALTKAEVGSLLRFLEKKEEEENDADNDKNLQNLRNIIVAELRNKNDSEESSEEIVTACRRQKPKAASSCNETIKIEFPQCEVSNLIKILNGQKELLSKKRKNDEYVHILPHKKTAPPEPQLERQTSNQNEKARIQFNANAGFLIG